MQQRAFQLGEADQLAVALRVVLILLGIQERMAVERLDPDEHLIAAGAAKQFDKLGLAHHLGEARR